MWRMSMWCTHGAEKKQALHPSTQAVSSASAAAEGARAIARTYSIKTSTLDDHRQTVRQKML
jgi:hypothetical protein